MSTQGQHPPPGGAVTGGTPPPVAVQQTTVIQVGSPKSVLGAVLLALFFGPLGMLYATVSGALVMFVVNLIVAFLTFGLGLIVTVPLGALWAGIAASNHNGKLGAMSQTVASSTTPSPTGVTQSPGAPAGWHDDPEGSDKLRYWDGQRWTDHFADRPNQADESATEQLPVASASAASADETVSCDSCGEQVTRADQFCSACGARQASG